MQAVILAGGKGKRLMPLTRNIPKPMVLIDNKPYLQYQIEFLKKQDIKDIVLLVGYLNEKIMEYFGDGKKFGVSIKYSAEDELLGTAGAIKNAEKLLKDVFFVIYGDSFLPIDLHEVYGFFQGYDKQALMVIYDNDEDTFVKNNVAIDDGNKVIAYYKDSKKPLPYVEAGILLLKKDVLKLIPKNKNVSMEKEIFPALVKKKQLVAFLTHQRFYDIGTKERLEVIKEYFKRG